MQARCKGIGGRALAEAEACEGELEVQRLGPPSLNQGHIAVDREYIQVDDEEEPEQA